MQEHIFVVYWMKGSLLEKISHPALIVSVVIMLFS